MLLLPSSDEDMSIVSIDPQPLRHTTHLLQPCKADWLCAARRHSQRRRGKEPREECLEAISRTISWVRCCSSRREHTFLPFDTVRASLTSVGWDSSKTRSKPRHFIRPILRSQNSLRSISERTVIELSNLSVRNRLCKYYSGLRESFTFWLGT